MVKINNLILILAVSLLVGLGFSSKAFASCSQGQQSCSGTYGVGEVFFGSGGSLDTTCSTGSVGYCAKQAVGETAVGLTSGSSYQAYAGFNVNREPSLQFNVNTTSINFGTLTDSTTATATATFSVETYLSSGYSVITVSNPPQNGPYITAAPSSPTASFVGTEQFGINLVANTTVCGAPANFGLGPSQVPDVTFSYGQAATGYNTCGLFKYVNNSTIADSTKSSGETDFTISYIWNISSVTPAGVYSMAQQLVATPTF